MAFSQEGGSSFNALLNKLVYRTQRFANCCDAIRNRLRQLQTNLIGFFAQGTVENAIYSRSLVHPSQICHNMDKFYSMCFKKDHSKITDIFNRHRNDG